MNNMNTATLQPVIQCQQLTKLFNDGNRHIQILHQLDFTLMPQERVAIIGASGSGKSTLLHILGGLDRASQGAVYIMDHLITHYTNRQLNRIRNRYIGFVYQFHHLLPEFSVLENVAMPLLIQGESLATAQQKAWQILAQLSLNERAHHSPSEISGGERARTAIGRALITKPLFILADELTGNLDNTTAHQIIDALCKVKETSLVIVTHDLSIAQRMDRILELREGRLMPISHHQ
jgi:lipoprotein-releasing system ATP-binding protein